jgi:hypothetical protein
MLFLSSVVILGHLPTYILAAPVQPHPRSMKLGPGPLVLPPAAISAMDIAAHQIIHSAAIITRTHTATKTAAAQANAAGPTLLAIASQDSPAAISNLVFPAPDAGAAQHALAAPNVNTVTAIAQPTPDSTFTLSDSPQSSSTPAKAKASSAAGKGFLVATYWPDWTSDVLPPEQVDFDRFDWVDYGSPPSFVPLFIDPDASYP